ncbi:MAG: zinc ribbon domain-containing protein, partial [Candidatus Limnocylindrales bacterium]
MPRRRVAARVLEPWPAVSNPHRATGHSTRGSGTLLTGVGEGEDTAIVTCTSCSADNSAGRRFCDQCGASLAVACPSCGGENRS